MFREWMLRCGESTKQRVKSGVWRVEFNFKEWNVKSGEWSFISESEVWRVESGIFKILGLSAKLEMVLCTA